MVYDVKLVKNFRELLESSVEEYGDRTAFLYKEGTEQREKTYCQARDDVRALAAYLRSIVGEGEKLALIGGNGYGWAIGYLAVTCGVGAVVPIDREMKHDDIISILKMTESSAVICTKGFKTDLSDCGIPVIDLAKTDEILCKGYELLNNSDPYFEHMIYPDSLGVLLYTSGTSGSSKGVMLSQYNICSDIMCVLKQVYVSCEDRVLSVLPLSHTYECTAGFLAILYSGGSIAYAENLRRMVADMQYYKPTIFVTVPLIMEVIYKNINSKVEGDKTKRLIFSAARIVSKTLSAAKIDARRKIYKDVHEAFGGKLRLILCGGAALSPELKRKFISLGFNVYCGYGLTETSPIILGDNDFYQDPETSGRPLCGVKVKLIEPDGDGVGELAVRSSVVMLGYYKNEEETARAFDDGWFKTGDLAKKNEDGSYTIVGRCKSMIVKNNGKKVMPEELEELLNKSPYIAESFVYGHTEDDGRTEVEASVRLDEKQIERYFADISAEMSDEEYEKHVYLLIRQQVKAINEALPVYKHIHRFYIRKKEFSLTSSKKIKRADKSNMGNGEE